MEVACGEYGDNVPKLVVALKTGKARQFQNYSSKKLVNVKLAPEVKQINDSAYDSDGGGGAAMAGSHMAGLSLLTNLDLKETAILDDNLSDCDTVSILSGAGATAHACAGGGASRAACVKNSTPMVTSLAYTGNSARSQPTDMTLSFNAHSAICDSTTSPTAAALDKEKVACEKDAKECEVSAP